MDLSWRIWVHPFFSWNPCGNHFDILFSPFFCVGLVKDYLVKSDTYLNSWYVFINNTGWFSKFWCSQKLAQTGRWVLGCSYHHFICRLSTEMFLERIFLPQLFTSFKQCLKRYSWFSPFTFEDLKNSHKDISTMVLETIFQETQKDSPIMVRK